MRKAASEAIPHIYTKELIAAMICAAQNGVFRFSIQEKTDGIETVYDPFPWPEAESQRQIMLV